MDLKLIKSLIEMIANNTVDEISIEEGDFKIKVKKHAEPASPQVFHVQASQPMQPASIHTTPAPSVSVTPSVQEESQKTIATANNNHITIKSPIVGTFYKSPSPEDPPFVSPGSSVSKGNTLCIVEAMKIMNEIESEYSGKIVETLVENAQPVEFDQPLFIIDPA